jgi:hypothetical protein
VFHMFAHNVDDVEAAKQGAHQIGVDFHAARGRVVGPDWDPDARWIPHEHVEPMPCPTLFHTAVIYGDGSVAPCRGSFYPQDDLGRVAADGRPGAATFREVWTGEGFQIARRLFRERTETAETRERICFACPHLLDWHRYVAHRLEGGRRADWTPMFTGNQRYNYFWSRGPRGRAGGRDADRAERAGSLVPGGAGG